VALSLGACAGGPHPEVRDLRGRRIVPIDRPTVATEYASGRRTIRVDLDGVARGPAGFTLALELPDARVDPPAERLVELPSADANAILVVAGEQGRPYSSRDARGTVRVRDFGDRSLAVVDLEFEGTAIDPKLRLPVHLFREGDDRLRLSGSFTAER